MLRMANSSVVTVALPKAKLVRKLRRHLNDLGFQKAEDGSLRIEGSGKDVIRKLHRSQREEKLRANKAFLDARASDLLGHFASGEEVDPNKIAPELERIRAGTWQSELFRLASLTWSVPVSNGFGRRLRYIVWDRWNDRIIGLIAIGDPVFNLSVRDNLIGWDAEARGSRLVNIMDAYVLGAVPPYNSLLGGKMVACMIRSREVYDDFTKTYGSTTGIISQKKKKARLLAVTTSSSMGRSSVYNRLKLNGIQYFQPIGYTGGWGHFHIPDSLFTELRNYLREIGHPYVDFHRFGQGPNWRLRTTRAALTSLGFKNDLLRHGIRREVFMCHMVGNGLDILQKGRGHPDTSSLLSVGEIGETATERWLLPRSTRRPEFKGWAKEGVIDLLGSQHLTGRIMQDAR